MKNSNRTEDAMFCMKCGNAIAGNARFCNVCGSPLSNNQQDENGFATPSFTQSAPTATSIPPRVATTQSPSGFQQTPPMQNGSKSRSKVIPAIVGSSLLAAALIVTIVFFAFGKTAPSSNENQSSTAYQVAVESTDEKPSASTPTFGIPSASSTLTDDVDSHSPNLLVDKDSTTAWSEGVAGPGEGSYVLFSATSLQSVHAVSIMGGFCKTESLYYKNSRPKSVTVSFSDGSSTTQTLQDTPFAWQTITLEDTIQTDFVKVNINSVYYGSKYEDTCISEIVIQ